MAYTRHVAVQANFAMPGGEVASCTLRFDLPGDSFEQPQIQAAADAARVAWATFVGTANARFSTAVSLTTVLVRLYNVAGVAIAAAESASAGPTAGTGTLTFPNEVAVCLSLNTLTPTRSGRGRIYLPVLANTMGTNGKLTSGNLPPILAAAKVCILSLQGNLETALGLSVGDCPLVVASKVEGLNRRVTAVRLGDVPDVQRRRQYDLPESFLVATIP